MDDSGRHNDSRSEPEVTVLVEFMRVHSWIQASGPRDPMGARGEDSKLLISVSGGGQEVRKRKC
jgi:hypothetical protein